MALPSATVRAKKIVRSDFIFLSSLSRQAARPEQPAPDALG
jgi:hypothetical protein